MCKLKSRSSKNPGLDLSNLPQISNFGWEFVEKSGVQMKNLKMKRKMNKIFDLPEWEFEPRIFEQIPAQNLNFEGDQIN